MSTDTQASPTPPKQLGHWLVREGYVSQTVLDEALAQQRRHGGQLGQWLTHTGKVTTLALYQTLASQHSMPFVNLLQQIPDASCINPDDASQYLAYGLLPVKRLPDGALLVATTHPAPSPTHITTLFGDVQRLTFHMTSPLDIAWAVQSCCHLRLSDNACEGLRRDFPADALRGGINRLAFPLTSLLLIMVISFCCLLFPVLSAHVLLVTISGFFLSILLFKLLLVGVGTVQRKAVFANSKVALLNDADCPVYTVLVPLYREAACVSDLLKVLGALDYPPTKLDIKLLVEADDAETAGAIREAAPDARFHLVVVPPSMPKTKPKACNYGMQFARGEYVTIYDAEDAPDPQQLRLAASVFAHHGNVSCLQACLQYYNSNQNWLTRFFALEYRMLFHYLLPALYALHIPIPLGGTSNHLRRDVLDDLGRWDAYNVTEDADLGVRLYTRGHVVLPIASHTGEEAPASVRDWIKQRSRWIKGYFQTWSVLCRNHKIRLQQLGLRGYLGIHYFIGAASASFVLAPCCWAIAACWWLVEPEALPVQPWATQLCLATLGIGVLVQWLSAALVVMQYRMPKRWQTATLFPGYFVLHTLASVKSIWQLVWRPYYWEKTTHAQTSVPRSCLTA